MQEGNDLPDLLVADIETLEDDSFVIEVDRTANTAHVVFIDFDLPDKFNFDTTDVLVNVPAPRLYPQGGIDMFWTEEELRLSDGAIPERAEVTKRMIGREWRRFSYHRGDNDDPDWNADYNDLVDHVSFIKQRFAELD